MRDIAEALGVPLASVYHSFGDKKSIFLSTLNCYFERAMKPNFDALHAMPSPKKAIHSFFDGMASQCSSDTAPPGCYLVQVASELSVNDPELARAAADLLTYVRKELKTLVDKAKKSGEISATQSSELLAHYLFTTMLGIKSCARTGIAQRQVRETTRLALSVLE